VRPEPSRVLVPDSPEWRVNLVFGPDVLLGPEPSRAWVSEDGHRHMAWDDEEGTRTIDATLAERLLDG